MKIAKLGSGFIARFYATFLQAQRRKDFVYKVYSRNITNAKRFADTGAAMRLTWKHKLPFRTMKIII